MKVDSQIRSTQGTFTLLAALALAALPAVAPRAQAQSGIKVYVSAPAVSTQTYSSAQIESFTTFSAATFTSLSSTALGGTYAVSGTASSSITNGGNYAASTGSGNYLAVAQGSIVTLTLGSAVPYVGLDFSAADAGNNLRFFDAGGVLIGTFSASDLVNLLPNNTTSTVTSVGTTNNGVTTGQSTYHTNLYYGQPNTATPPTATATNNGEPYAYLHFFGQNGTKIKTIEFSQKGTSGTFESDNHSILTTQPAVDGSFVLVGAVVPEPGVNAMIAAGCAGLLALRRWRRSGKR